MNKELENLEHIKDVLISMNFAFDDITAGLTFQVFKPLQFSFESNSRKDKNGFYNNSNFT